jgi:hypothetical protein
MGLVNKSPETHILADSRCAICSVLSEYGQERRDDPELQLRSSFPKAVFIVQRQVLPGCN